MQIKTQWIFTKEEAEKEIKEFDEYDKEWDNYSRPENWEQMTEKEKIMWFWKEGKYDGVEFDKYTNCYTTLSDIIIEK